MGLSPGLAFHTSWFCFCDLGVGQPSPPCLPPHILSYRRQKLLSFLERTCTTPMWGEGGSPQVCSQSLATFQVQTKSLATFQVQTWGQQVCVWIPKPGVCSASIRALCWFSVLDSPLPAAAAIQPCLEVTQHSHHPCSTFRPGGCGRAAIGSREAADSAVGLSRFSLLEELCVLCSPAAATALGI